MGGNGSGGRNRKPKLLKVLEGDRGKIGKKKLEAIREPVARGEPLCPDYFNAEQQKLWDAAIRSAPPGLLTAADSALLEIFVGAWDMLHQVNKQIAATSLLVRSERGAIKNPLLSIRRMASADLNAAASQLGMSPWARSRLIATPEAENDPMALLLGWDSDPAAQWSVQPRARQ